VSRYQKGKTNLDFTEARDSEWQWHQLGHMQVCISLQTDNHASNPLLSLLQAGCPSCHPTNCIKALFSLLLAQDFSLSGVELPDLLIGLIWLSVCWDFYVLFCIYNVCGCTFALHLNQYYYWYQAS